MSNTATGILKDALKEAEADRDKVLQDTEHIRREGERAERLVAAAQRRVDDLVKALDRLNRPEHMVEESAEPSFDHQEERTFVRPDIEERSVGGIGITRRSAAS